MVEASTCFLPMAKGLNGVQTWPQNTATFRTSDLTAALQEYLDESSTPERFEVYVQRCETRTRENHEYMKMCVSLYRWKFKFENAIKTVKNGNEKIGQAIAKAHGIEYWDLAATPSYGALLQAKNQSLENIADIDYDVRQATINAELLKIKEQRARRTHEETYRQARASVAKHYNRLRAGRLEMPLPTLEVFRDLPIVAQLQKNSQPNINLDNELKSSVITSLLHTQLEEWREKAMDHLLTLLGLPTGWKSASKNKLHPTQRVTARFRCGRCTRIEMRNREDECLDLAGVCAHTCEASKKGRIPQWKIENFVKDDKAIDAMTKVVVLCDVNPEDSSSIAALKAFGHKIICQSCDALIIMTPGNVVGHSHRHDDMQIRLATNEEAESMATHPPVQLAQKLLGMEKRAQNARKVVAFGCRHCAQWAPTPSPNDGGPPNNSNNQGNEELVTASSAVNPPAVTSTTSSGDGAPGTTGEIYLGRKAADKGTSAAPNSGSGADDARPTGASTKPTKRPGLFNFDGLRSHLKIKHNVLNIRDEDLYCTQLEEVLKLCN
ncbi:hypothetical protein AAF712_015400 [Marasmius tenuissimus]|uniref:Uncharacterized protein n=1 Tax=Marasmius tenuissimus TaxID=585030 RepID=A0ABR2Z8F7_9AGAR